MYAPSVTRLGMRALSVPQVMAGANDTEAHLREMYVAMQISRRSQAPSLPVREDIQITLVTAMSVLDQVQRPLCSTILKQLSTRV